MVRRVVILENIRSMHSVGSIFRTSDGAVWDHVFLCGYTGCPPDRRIEKVSLGAENFISWEKADSAIEVCKKLKSEGFKIIALEQTDRAENLFGAEISDKKVALVLGNEVEGVSDEVLDFSDRHLQIPMKGQKSSLNVSVAAGIALFEIARKLD